MMEEILKAIEKTTKEETICGQFLKKRNTYENLIFFGAGLCCTDTLHLFQSENIAYPVAICDNNQDKWGQTIENIPIMSLAQVKEKYQNPTILVTTSMFIEEVTMQIKKECPEAQIISFTPYEYENFDLFQEYVLKQQEDFLKIYHLLDEERSKETWCAVLKGRSTGNDAEYRMVYEAPQYFPKEILPLGENEVFLDIGAFIGDTAEEFIRQVSGRYQKIIEVEPNPLNHEKIEAVMEKNKNMELIPKGISDKKEILYFDSTAGSSSGFCQGTGDIKIEVDTIDALIFEPVTFIKMDIEGLELSALQGAVETIKKYKPKLAICIYHKINDFIEIPEFINSLNLGYKFYVRHHMLSLNETVLYGI